MSTSTTAVVPQTDASDRVLAEGGFSGAGFGARSGRDQREAVVAVGSEEAPTMASSVARDGSLSELVPEHQQQQSTSSTPPINVKRSRFPYAIVWSPLP